MHALSPVLNSCLSVCPSVCPSVRLRDIKTTNVLIDSQWRAKICDFSFCVQEQEQGAAREDCFVYGTTEFMAPEIALGEEFGVSAGPHPSTTHHFSQHTLLMLLHPLPLDCCHTTHKEINLIL